MAANSKAVGIAAILVIVAANGFLLWRTFAHPQSNARGERAFYSIDDGKTWFAHSTGQRAPFEYEGKEAVMAHVYQGKDGKFVGYLERTPEKGRKMLEAVAKKQAAPSQLATVPLIEVKRPGDARWYTPFDGKKYADVITVRDPNGGPTPLEVQPGD